MTSLMWLTLVGLAQVDQASSARLRRRPIYIASLVALEAAAASCLASTPAVAP